MFNSDVTQTYKFQDATMEMLIMLTGAFLLGCLLCWLLRSLLGSRRKTRKTNGIVSGNHHDLNAELNSGHNHERSESGRTAQSLSSGIEKQSDEYTKPRIDDLTKISGINNGVESELKKNGIRSYIDLRDNNNKQAIIDTLASDNGALVSNKEAQTWPHQASLAAKGEWGKLKEYQDFRVRTQKAANNINTATINRANQTRNTTKTAGTSDDLKKIEGIGPKIEELLNSNGIETFKDLRKSDVDTLRGHLSSEGSRFKMHNPQSWPQQAEMAERGEWEELKIFQEFMEEDDSDFSASDNDVNTTADLDKDLNTHTNVDTDNAVEKLHQDDLKKIEGIGPKIEEVLNKNGIKSFSQLSIAKRDTLKGFLNDAGSQFQMHEPESWPHQAGMAQRGEWEALRVYQEFMDGGRETPSASASSSIKSEPTSLDSKRSSRSNKSDSSNVDDLKVIEGIGPKIEAVLNKNGITTFDQLYKTERDTLKDFLDDAGSQFQMHEPESWPHQAGMAAHGDWEELRIYQEFMDGGRETPSASASSSLHVKRSSSKQKDDLKIIEGIGPKIQELLNKSGINSFEDLKNSNRDTLKAFLGNAGPQYRMHEPETWPQQASMAFNGEWEKLEEYKEVLIGGRE
ncbi:MAG: helix-hairpin-helix domain-containing protein [Cocleimonas sp.]